MKRPPDPSTTMTLTEAPTASASMSVSFLDRGLDTSGGLGFIQERLALMGKMVFLDALWLMASRKTTSRAQAGRVTRSAIPAIVEPR